MQPRVAVLHGRDHTALCEIGAIAEGPAAISLSLGGARKVYSHLDPNEDSAALARGEGGMLVAVADGHAGARAAELAIARLLEHFAPGWTAADAGDLRARWDEDARAALLDLHVWILRELAREDAVGSRTTLALAVVRPAERWLGYASLGDSHVFVAGRSEAAEVARQDPETMAFLGTASEDRESLRPQCAVGSEEVGDARAVVLATDGISERGIGHGDPEAAVADAIERAARARPELRPLDAARAVVADALEAHRRNRSGDNVSSAVVWLGE